MKPRLPPLLRPLLCLLLAAATLPACKRVDSDAPLQAEAGEALQGGQATVADESFNAFGNQVPGLTTEQATQFVVGNSLFRTNWVTAPAASTSVDGLGPMLNAASCGACHPNDGRGAAPMPGETPTGVLLRIGAPDGRPDPIYGDQLQNRAIAAARAEATVSVSYAAVPFAYPDGTTVQLRRPTYTVTDWNFGPPIADLVISPRIGQQLPGLGLLELVPEQTIAAAADEDDRDHDGISGRAPWLAQADGSRKLGRFGWKAGRTSLADQASAAFANDMGITSDLVPQDAMTATQSLRYGRLPNGGTPEISAENFEKVRVYLLGLAVPSRRQVSDPQVLTGKALFMQIGCGKCHTPAMQTGPSDIAAMSNQKIRPYTDMLLHDMGDDLADHRAEGAATGMEWRTPPLWGLGLVERVSGKAHLLHDGRALSPEEAILWHGGEAVQAKTAFTTLTATERGQVLAFLRSL